MRTTRDDATCGEYVDAVRSGATTAEAVAPLVRQPVDKARRSLNTLHCLSVLKREGAAKNGTYTVRQHLDFSDDEAQERKRHG